VRILIQSIALCVVLAASLFAENTPEYSPLDKNQKKLFKKSHIALLKALEEGNLETFRLFAPGVLSKYESIMIDPQCILNRDTYRINSPLCLTVLNYPSVKRSNPRTFMLFSMCLQR
jgi:hypothetical protein